MATLDNPTALSLGRVGVSAVDMRSTAQMLTPQPTALDGLMQIGKTIAGGLVKEQKRKEFYSGQDRILQASLEGTQKEELQNILAEQPYYMTMLGNGATADGAIEMASRVGAGKIFDDSNARLATGQDAEIDPDTYRQGIMAQIGAQRTGNEQVDAVFMPQMITKGQALISTHLQKHLEHNNRQTGHHIIQESLGAMTSLESVLKSEYNDSTATFDDRVPTEALLPATKEQYKALVNSFNPDTRPLNVAEEGWTALKLPLAVASIEKGNTAIAKAMKEGGMYARLKPEDMVKVDAAVVKGKINNDANYATELHVDEVNLDRLAMRATDGTDIQAVHNQATAIRQKYLAKGITPPAKFKDADAIAAWVHTAVSSERSNELRLQKARDASDKLDKIAIDAAAGVEQTHQFHAAKLRKAIGGDPTASVQVTNQDGTVSLIPDTKEDRVATYTAYVSQLESLPKADRDAALKSKGVSTKEGLADLFQLEDEGTKGKLTQMLRSTLGQQADSKLVPKRVMDNIGSALAIMDSLQANIPDASVKRYFPDENLQKNYLLYKNNLKVTGDVMSAWDASFGAEQGVQIKYNEANLKKAIKSSAYQDAIKAAGNKGFELAAWLETEAKHNMLGYAKTEQDAVELALQTHADYTETVNGQSLLGVPPASRIGTKIGITDRDLTDAAVDTYVKSKLAEGFSYQIDFLPSANNHAGGHIVFPINQDGSILNNAKFILPYSEVKALLSNPVEYKKAKQHRNKLKGAASINAVFGNGDTNPAFKF